MFNSVLGQRKVRPAGNLVSRICDGSTGYAGSRPFIWRNEEQISIYGFTSGLGECLSFCEKGQADRHLTLESNRDSLSGLEARSEIGTWLVPESSSF